MFVRYAVLAPVILLLGCGEAAYLSYQGRPAETALECKAAYEEARRRGSGVDYSSGATIIGSAIGKGLSSGMIESAYESCLARVSTLPAPAEEALPRTAGPQSRPASSLPGGGCAKGGGVLQGGSGYC